MKIRINKGFRRVLSVLVAVMLLVGVMPLSAVPVNAATRTVTVYFCKDMGGADFTCATPFINYWGANSSPSYPNSSNLPLMNYCGDAVHEAVGYYIHSYTLTFNTSSSYGIEFSNTKSKNDSNSWYTESITGDDVKDGYLYYTQGTVENSTTVYKVYSIPYSSVPMTLYFSKNMATSHLTGSNIYINAWYGDLQIANKIQMTSQSSVQGFNIDKRDCNFIIAPTKISFTDGSNSTEKTTDINNNYLYYDKWSYSKHQAYCFPYSDLIYGYLTSSNAFNATKDMNVIVDSSGTFKQDAERHYVRATMYDYFSDYEIINGKTRTGGDKANAVNAGITVPYNSWEDPYRRMPLLTFDKALSNYYGSATYQHPLYFGDIHDESDGYFFSIYNNNQWNLNYNNSYNQLYHDNNSKRRSGLAVTDESQEPNTATTGLYKTSLSAYDETAANTVNAARLQLTGGAYAKWFDDTWLSAGSGNTHNSTGKMIGASYDVDFPFWTINMARTIGSQTYNSCQYYYINSEKKEHALRMHKDSQDTYYLKETGQGIYNFSGNDEKILANDPSETSLSTTYGFFPFNSKQDFYIGGNITSASPTYATDVNGDLGNLMNYRLRMDRTNYCFGTYMVIPFTLTSNNGTVNGTTDATDAPITFSFSGDDDLLVYIDNQLVLDIGGDHGKVQGEINLKEKKSWVSSVKTTTGTATQNITWSGTEKLQTMSAIPSSGAGVTTLADALCAKGKHVMEIFYVERGLFDSNMEIMYNLPVVEDRSFTVEEHIPTSADVASQVDSVFTSGSAGENFMSNVNRIKLGINVQFSEPNETSNFGTLLGGRTEYTGDHPANYTFGSTLYENTFGGDTTNNIYTTTMSNGQKLTYVNDFIKHYNYNLKVWEGNIFIGNGDTGQPVGYLFNTNWTLAKLNGTPQSPVSNAGPATDGSTTSGSSRPKRATKTTSTSATNNGFDFRGTQANPDAIVFSNSMNTYTLTVKKKFIRDANDSDPHTFKITVTFDNVGGLNLEESDPLSGGGTTITKELTFTFNSGEGTGTGGTTKQELIVVPANTLYMVEETQAADGYDKSGEVTGLTAPSGDTEVTITNKPPEHKLIILKIQKVWENTSTFPTSIKFKVEKSTDSESNFTAMTNGTVVGADGNAISGVTFSNGDLTLNSNCTTTLGDGRTAWVAYIYDNNNYSDNIYEYRVTEYAGTTILADNATFKPDTVTFKVKYTDTTGLINNGHYNDERQTGLTNPSGNTGDYGNSSAEGGRVLTLSVLNRAFIKIRVQSYFTQKNEAQQTGLPSTSPYVKMKVQQYNTSTSQWENVKNDANTDTSEVSITSAAWTDTNPDPQRKYFEYVLDGEYDPDYTYRVLEYASGNDTTPIENGGSFSEVFAKVNYSFDAAQKKNERDGTDFDSSWSGVKGITLAVLNSGDGSSEIVNTGGRGGYVPIAGGFIAILLAGAGYFIYKKRIFA